MKYSQVYPSVVDPRKLKLQGVEVHFAGWNDFGEVLIVWTNSELRDVLEWICDIHDEQGERKAVKSKKKQYES